jgi:N-carbamoylputrescine amidase
LFYPTAIGWHPAEKNEFGAAQLDAWRTIQRSHAIANGIFVAAVNRVGFEGPRENGPGQNGIEFWGSSFVADPFGQLIAQASTDKEETLVVECDLRRMEEVRRSWPFLRDRRIDAYGPLLERWID